MRFPLEFTEFSQIFASAAIKNNIPVPNEAQMLQFYRFTEYLLEINAHTNLTAIREPIGIIDKHYVEEFERTGYFAAINKGTLFAFAIDGKEHGSFTL